MMWLIILINEQSEGKKRTNITLNVTFRNRHLACQTSFAAVAFSSEGLWRIKETDSNIDITHRNDTNAAENRLQIRPCSILAQKTPSSEICRLKHTRTT